MSVECMANDYAIIEKEGNYYVYNQFYEAPLQFILLAALVGLLIPDSSDYYIPICIEIKKEDNQKIVITKNLEVRGCKEYKYFIARHQYNKWKKINAVVKGLIYGISIAAISLSVLLFIKTNYNLGLGICVLVLIILVVGAMTKLEINNKKRKMYELKNIVFDK